jgi:hypothetical protein
LAPDRLVSAVSISFFSVLSCLSVISATTRPLVLV